MWSYVYAGAGHLSVCQSYTGSVCCTVVFHAVTGMINCVMCECSGFGVGMVIVSDSYLVSNIPTDVLPPNATFILSGCLYLVCFCIWIKLDAHYTCEEGANVRMPRLSALTVAFLNRFLPKVAHRTDVTTRKVRTSSLGVNITPPLPLFCPQKLLFWSQNVLKMHANKLALKVICNSFFTKLMKK